MSLAAKRLTALTETALERTSESRRKQIVADVREVLEDRRRLGEYLVAAMSIFAVVVVLILATGGR